MADMELREMFAANLKCQLKAHDKSQADLARYLGVSTATTANWCSGKIMPRVDKIQSICNWLFIEKSDLLDEPTEKAVVPSRGVKIPVLGRVAAGIPIEAIENIIDTEEIPEDMARRGEYFGLKIKGTSMQPVICDGDTVIVRKQEDADSDEIVIATINSDDATCKRLMKYEGGLSLISYNPEFAPMTFTNKQLKEIPVRIIGRVVEDRRKF